MDFYTLLFATICGLLALWLGKCYMHYVNPKAVIAKYWRKLVIDNVWWLVAIGSAYIVGYGHATFAFNIMGQALRGTMFNLGG